MRDRIEHPNIFGTSGFCTLSEKNRLLVKVRYSPAAAQQAALQQPSRASSRIGSVGRHLGRTNLRILLYCVNEALHVLYLLSVSVEGCWSACESCVDFGFLSGLVVCPL